MLERIKRIVAIAGLVALSLFYANEIWRSSLLPPHDQEQYESPKGIQDKSSKSATEERLADYTWWLAVLTAGLVAASIIQFGLLIRAEKLTQKTLVLTQRPRLRVRNVVVRHPQHQASPPLFTEGHLLEGQFYVANVGGTPATITEALAVIFQTRSGLPMRRPYEGRDANLAVPRGSLAPGKSFPLLFYGDEAIRQGAQAIGNTQIAQGLRLFVMGWIEYSDDIGVIRRTAFCREFRAGPFDDGRFHAINDPDYEHEE